MTLYHSTHFGHHTTAVLCGPTVTVDSADNGLAVTKFRAATASAGTVSVNFLSVVRFMPIK